MGMLNPVDLPNDIATLKALLAASEGRNLRKQDRIDQLEKLVADFKRALFGARSQKTDPEQFDLALEDIETAMAAVHAEDEALDGTVALAYCWAHARRKLHEVAQSGTTPIAEEGLKQIAALYRIEKDIRGLSAGARLAARQDRSAPLIAAFEAWMTAHRARVSAKAPSGEALKYIAKYWDGLCLFLSDGRIEMDSNTVERTIRPIALNRKNALFAGHDAGAANRGVIASLIETSKLHDVDPHAYLTGTLTAIVNGHKQSEIDALLPWN